MKDTHGDLIEVDPAEGVLGREVFLTVHDSGRGAEAVAALTPKKARRLARALKKAAKRVERGA